MNYATAAPTGDEQQFDTVYLNSRREAVIIFGVWVVCLLWSVPYCYIFCYPPGDAEFNPDTFSMIWGVPSWVCWGILFPWGASNLFTIWFCFFYMQDDDLGEAREGVDLAEEIAERHAAEDGGAGR